MKNVLIADDSRLVRITLTKILVDVLPQYTIIEASDGEEALSLAKENLLDIAFIDYNMPKLDGFKLAIELRDLFTELPIIMVTANKQSIVENRAEGRGISYIPKPITEQESVEFKNQILRTLIKYGVS